jgi:hypothetical protein
MSWPRRRAHFISRVAEPDLSRTIKAAIRSVFYSRRRASSGDSGWVRGTRSYDELLVWTLHVYAARAPQLCRLDVKPIVMTASIFSKAFSLWLAILIMAIINGILRDKALIPAMGSFWAFIGSGAVLSGCIFTVAFVAVPWYGGLSSSQWLLVGLLWLLLTLAFEFCFGRFAQHKSWVELLEAYTFKGGNIWPLILVVTLFSPWLAAKLRGLS